jgi:uncharacterized Zn-binding protein involved in type VI secretion
MPACQRLQDANAGGGMLTSTPQTIVTVDGQRVAVVGAKGTAHPPCPEDDSHCAGVWQTAGGSGSVRIAGQAVIRTQDADTCGHRRIGGSPTVRVGD